MIKTDGSKRRIESVLASPEMQPQRYRQAPYIPVLRCRGVDSNEVTLTGEEARSARVDRDAFHTG